MQIEPISNIFMYMDLIVSILIIAFSLMLLPAKTQNDERLFTLAMMVLLIIMLFGYLYISTSLRSVYKKLEKGGFGRSVEIKKNDVFFIPIKAEEEDKP